MVYAYEMNDRKESMGTEVYPYDSYPESHQNGEDRVQKWRGQRVDIFTNSPSTSNGYSTQSVGVFVNDGGKVMGVHGKETEHDEDPRMASMFQKSQFTILIVLFQIAFFILFGVFARYDPSALPSSETEDPMPVAKQYPLYQDTHVMIFVGFGFLMTFLRRYGFMAISINLLLACFVIEWGLLVRGFVGHEFAHNGYFTIGLEQLLTADFAAAVVLISMGAMLGKLSPVQYIIMAFIEVPVSIFIEHQVVHGLQINDVGGSIVVHVFGAYFGLACSRAFAKKEQRDHENEGSNYQSDIFAMIGAIFLWVFWPSFNAAVAEPADARQRAIINTVLSLVGSTIATFLVSQALDHHKKFDMVHVANSTLAGGVAIGTCANVVLNPLHALLVGTVAGVISVYGYKVITPFFTSKLGMHDTCGVHNLHGMPGVIAAIASFVFALAYEPSVYGKSLNIIYPGMHSASNAEGFTAMTQGLRQLAALGIVLVASLASGFITGAILKLKVWNQVRDKENYADADYFEVPSDYDFTTRIVSCIDHVDIAERTPLTKEMKEV